MPSPDDDDDKLHETKEQCDVPKCIEELEDVFLIQVPNDIAEQFNLLLGGKCHKSTDVQVTFGEATDGAPQAATITVDGYDLPGRLCNLPTVVEVHKSFDIESGKYYKANQIGQMLVVDHCESALPTDVELPHGLSIPTQSIRRRKWDKRRPRRMVGKYTSIEMEQLQKELACIAAGKKFGKQYEVMYEDVYEFVS